ncbi:MAG: ThuA domain-containing protein [Candidatus Hydrogenedentes bacterium]|nr:ThuA domain-containing protein [Candidatus Hydrogenedentota bacterium]
MKVEILLVCMVGLLLGSSGYPETLKILYLTKSSGFEHSVVKREGSSLSYSENVLTKLCTGNNWQIECTKDASKINPENLKNYNVVIFYTSGDLTQSGTDEHPPMKTEDTKALLDWVRNGGGFIGIHSANDSFHSKGDKVSEYVEMLGGEFETHGHQFKGKVIVVDKGHPALGNFPEKWETMEEWYIMKNLNKETMHVLALLDPGDERNKQKMYDRPSYPIIWCIGYGKGRVVYNGLGHREDVWDSKEFQELLRAHILWASGQGPANAEPNYGKVVPTE